VSIVRAIVEGYADLPHGSGSYGHKQHSDRRVVVKLGKHPLSHRCVDVAIYAAERDPLFTEELAHEVQAPPPKREDNTGDVISYV
jgi:hypothetical protein